jgi:FHA domain-containing protein
MTTTWQADENDTEPAISFDLKKQLQGASKTIKFDIREFDLEVRPYAGNALFKKHTTVVFALVGSRVLLPLHITNRVIIGRLDLNSNEKADIDLMPYGGREAGVSRLHAALYRNRNTVSLVDLKSSNGTYLNGVKLIPHQPRLLREDDEVRLGNMQFRVYFAR